MRSEAAIPAEARPLSILALEPYAARSHAQFLDGLADSSRHCIELHTLPARKWKWRMRTASLHFADLLTARPRSPDLLFASDYVNVAELRGVLPDELRNLPVVSYFHENQLTYPLQEGERRDYHFALGHVHSALASEHVLFNSHFHRHQFLAALPEVLRLVPDVRVDAIPERIAAHSSVLPLGLVLERGAPSRPGAHAPIVVWNHRWEYDKGPAEFLAAIRELSDRGVSFRLRILGERFRKLPAEFLELRRRFADRIEWPESTPERAEYLARLGAGDITASAAHHEYFGLGTLEAMRLGLLPVLPRDLAYPELLPPDLRNDPRFLYSRADGLAGGLAAAIDAVRAGSWLDERQRIVESTDRFEWRQLAPRYDAMFERIVDESRKRAGRIQAGNAPSRACGGALQTLPPEDSV